MATPTSSSAVVICGAGAAGLTLAVDLARRGVDFRLIDKTPAAFVGSRGKGLQPRSLEVFEDLGVLDRIAVQARPYPPIRTWREDGGHDDALLAEHRDPTPDEPYAGTMMLPQFLTEAALRARLAELGHAPMFGHELIGFEQDADGVTARLATPRGEETWRARWLVGADGGRSLVRHALDIGFPGKTLEVRALVADLTLDGLTRDAWHRWMGGEEGQISLCPLAGTDLFQLQAALLQDGEPDLSAKGLAAMIARRTGRHDLVVREVLWASAYGMNARLADRYRVGRVLLAGDAAHIHPPTGGQGLNTGLQDGYNLGWKLAAVLAGAPESLIDTYETERRAIAAGVLGLSVGLLQAAQARAEMRRGRETQQLDLGYEGSPLAVERRPAPGRLQAGDRAPDAPCHRASGQATRLFEQFRGPHWTLLAYEVAASAVRAVTPRPGVEIHTVGPAGELIDTEGHLRSAYDLTPGTWILVRPDGYVGLMAGQGDEVAIETYLDQVTAKVRIPT